MVEEEWGNEQVPNGASAEVCCLIWSLGIGYLDGCLARLYSYPRGPSCQVTVLAPRALPEAPACQGVWPGRLLKGLLAVLCS